MSSETVSYNNNLNGSNSQYNNIASSATATAASSSSLMPQDSTNLPPGLINNSSLYGNQTQFPLSQQQQQQQQQQPHHPSLSLSHLEQFTQPHFHHSHHQSLQSPPVTGILKISNLPRDLTRREATLIFALVIDEVLSIDVSDYQIFALFKNFNTCITTGKLLDGQQIFGPEYPPIKIEFDHGLHSLDSPQALAQTQSAFSAMSLSSSTNISPPNKFSNIANAQGGNSNQLLNNINATSSNAQPVAPFDVLQKRQSSGNMRSRFAFSDPFLQEQQQQQQQQQQQSQQSKPQQPQNNFQAAPHRLSGSGPQIGSGHIQPQTASKFNFQPQMLSDGSSQPNGLGSSSANGSSGSRSSTGVGDFSEATGKSILLMESQNDARDYDQLVRDPWSSNPNNGTSLSAVQSPTVYSNPDWNNSAGAINTASNLTLQQPPDRRRTSSSFFNPQMPQEQMQLSSPPHRVTGPNQTPPHGPSASGLRSTLQQQSNSLNQRPEYPTGKGTQSSSSYVQEQKPPPVGSKTSPAALVHASPSAAAAAAASSSSSTTNKSMPTSKDIPELSLLARVPPPANPADQNPPCNTLYVGNLPPDATEAELRTLFAPQKGFRRLSFRTKNQTNNSTPGSTTSTGANSSGHNHGPMCFVEFEDVAHATRALAELYGRALPRPHAANNSKGGIRLSFSKNPLGVRGPGNVRRTSTNSSGATSNNTTSTQDASQKQSSSTAPSQAANGSTNGNGSNYSYSYSK